VLLAAAEPVPLPPFAPPSRGGPSRFVALGGAVTVTPAEGPPVLLGPRQTVRVTTALDGVHTSGIQLLTLAQAGQLAPSRLALRPPLAVPAILGHTEIQRATALAHLLLLTGPHLGPLPSRVPRSGMEKPGGAMAQYRTITTTQGFFRLTPAQVQVQNGPLRVIEGPSTPAGTRTFTAVTAVGTGARLTVANGPLISINGAAVSSLGVNGALGNLIFLGGNPVILNNVTIGNTPSPMILNHVISLPGSTIITGSVIRATGGVTVVTTTP
jgi:hypothetical protein